MSVAAFVMRKGPSGFGYGSTAERVTRGLDLTDRRYVLTGCNAGLGRETLRVLGMRGAHMVALARSEEKARRALEETGAAGTPLGCDLSEPASVNACVDAVKGFGHAVDGIICNAGIMALPKPEIVHGLERQFLTNHMGHFILVTGLLDALAEDARVVILSSDAHRMSKNGIDFENLDASRGYSPWRAYSQSKLANLLFAKAIARRFQGTRRTANAVHPGVIRTQLGRHMNLGLRAAMTVFGPLFLKNVAQGAATECYVATHPDLAEVSGQYFANCNIAKPIPAAEDPALATRLFEVSESLAKKLVRG
jgi:NAD(P)-dependent dehydrogenase (short-subunit alcohol dehydrogenase family)